MISYTETNCVSEYWNHQYLQISRSQNQLLHFHTDTVVESEWRSLPPPVVNILGIRKTVVFIIGTIGGTPSFNKKGILFLLSIVKYETILFFDKAFNYDCRTGRLHLVVATTFSRSTIKNTSRSIRPILMRPTVLERTWTRQIVCWSSSLVDPFERKNSCTEKDPLVAPKFFLQRKCLVWPWGRVQKWTLNSAICTQLHTSTTNMLTLIKMKCWKIAK